MSFFVADMAVLSLFLSVCRGGRQQKIIIYQERRKIQWREGIFREML